MIADKVPEHRDIQLWKLLGKRSLRDRLQLLEQGNVIVDKAFALRQSIDNEAKRAETLASTARDTLGTVFGSSGLHTGDHLRRAVDFSTACCIMGEHCQQTRRRFERQSAANDRQRISLLRHLKHHQKKSGIIGQRLAKLRKIRASLPAVLEAIEHEELFLLEARKK